jgi:RimJ/RimL family protein N-acetyltransferase
MAASLTELRPWFPTIEADARRNLTEPAVCDEASVRRWDDGEQFDYVLLDGEDVVGMGHLMRKIERGLVLGYWVRTDRTGRGLATAAAKALTAAALSLDGIDVVEARCDVANVRSAAVLAHAGFTLCEVVAHTIDAPGQTGSSQVWRIRHDLERIG